ncbi:CHRD domain-containing protein [Terrimonas sp. NA20]|uniref:CHRD domain-containing protein n=1 Tax=Terrimonas ginsenosidimutans TaxID=2908004 RepID=A0ABS9KTK0_9BACT|nr:CHRD domain-containing protein [Terrimonas ginsenosidimutans]MCG2615609.1 CHRD domain-containing protein [Terrimonas ginsenosidimutans]
MKLFRLTALGFLSFALFMGLSSCEKESEKKKVNFYTKSDISGTGAQIAPNPSPSTGLAKLSVSYDKRTKVLNYTISWSGLSDSVIAVRLNGPAPIGYSALRNPFTVATGDSTSFNTTPYIVLQQTTGTAPRALLPSTGTFTATFPIDEVTATELNLLNQYYYVTLHTKTTLPVPGAARFFFRWFGEVRAQVVFQ